MTTDTPCGCQDRAALADLVPQIIAIGAAVLVAVMVALIAVQAAKAASS